MKHPFDLPDTEPENHDHHAEQPISRRRALVTALAGVGGFATAAGSTHAQDATTERIGEEGGPVATTLALGEEGGGDTTKAVGEEGGRPTTRAVGEEGGGVAEGIRAAAERVSGLLRDGDLPSAYETYTAAKRRAAEHRLLGLLSEATIQIEAVAHYETGRALRILAGEPGNKDAAKEILATIAKMDQLGASRRARGR